MRREDFHAAVRQTEGEVGRAQLKVFRNASKRVDLVALAAALQRAQARRFYGQQYTKDVDTIMRQFFPKDAMDEDMKAVIAAMADGMLKAGRTELGGLIAKAK
jgi:hypothetical protein